jgi:hypothetical protein
MGTEHCLTQTLCGLSQAVHGMRYFLNYPAVSGFSGLGVSMVASGTQDRVFAPDRSRWIFPAGKIHSMPSFGGEVK